MRWRHPSADRDAYANRELSGRGSRRGDESPGFRGSSWGTVAKTRRTDPSPLFLSPPEFRGLGWADNLNTLAPLHANPNNDAKTERGR